MWRETRCKKKSKFNEKWWRLFIGGIVNLETSISSRKHRYQLGNIDINSETALLTWKKLCFQVNTDVSKLKVVFPSSELCFQVYNHVSQFCFQVNHHISKLSFQLSPKNAWKPWSLMCIVLLWITEAFLYRSRIRTYSGKVHYKMHHGVHYGVQFRVQKLIDRLILISWEDFCFILGIQFSLRWKYNFGHRILIEIRVVSLQESGILGPVRINQCPFHQSRYQMHMNNILRFGLLSNS